MAASFGKSFMDSALHSFRFTKGLGDGALAQCSDEDLIWAPAAECNSIAIIVRHLHGNMLSRWTGFPAEDGEKSWRNRDGEFEAPTDTSREAILAMWEEGWQCMFAALEPIAGASDVDQRLLAETTIRGQRLTVLDAIHRQIAHYSYHVGQLVDLAKMRRGAEWRTLSIARGRSGQFKPDGDRWVR